MKEGVPIKYGCFAEEFVVHGMCVGVYRLTRIIATGDISVNAGII